MRSVLSRSCTQTEINRAERRTIHQGDPPRFLARNPQVTRNALTDTWTVIDSYRLILVGKAGATLSADSTLLTALPSALLGDGEQGRTVSEVEA
jgi:hypothetical protein